MFNMREISHWERGEMTGISESEIDDYDPLEREKEFFEERRRREAYWRPLLSPSFRDCLLLERLRKIILESPEDTLVWRGRQIRIMEYLLGKGDDLWK